MLRAAWYDAGRFADVPPPTQKPAYFDEDGAAQGTLAALLASWREDLCPLALGDVPCRWLAADADGVRGYAVASAVSAFPVAVALAGRSTVAAAAVRAIKTIASLRDRGHHDALGWLGLPPSTDRAAIVLVASVWKVKPDVIEGTLGKAAKKFKGELRARVVSVNRCRDGLRRLVHVQTYHDGVVR